MGARKGGSLHSPDALGGTPLAAFAPVYAALAQRGISPPEVDEMEVWQVASALGVDMTDDTETAAGPPPVGSTINAARLAKIRAKQARMKAQP